MSNQEKLTPNSREQDIQSPDKAAQEVSRTVGALAATIEEVWMSTSKRLGAVNTYSRGR